MPREKHLYCTESALFNRALRGLPEMVKRDNVEGVVSLLSKNSSRVNAVDARGYTLLMLVESLEMFDGLYHFGVNLHQTTVYEGEVKHPFIELCGRGNVAVIVSYLHAVGTGAERLALINVAVDNETPLTRAALFGHAEVVNYLLRSGANAEVRVESINAADEHCYKTAEEIAASTLTDYIVGGRWRHSEAYGMRRGMTGLAETLNVFKAFREGGLASHDDMECGEDISLKLS